MHTLDDLGGPVDQAHVEDEAKGEARCVPSPAVISAISGALTVHRSPQIHSLCNL